MRMLTKLMPMPIIVDVVDADVDEVDVVDAMPMPTDAIVVDVERDADDIVQDSCRCRRLCQQIQFQMQI